VDARSDQQGVRKHHTLRTSEAGTRREKRRYFKRKIDQVMHNTTAKGRPSGRSGVGFCARQCFADCAKGKAERGAGRRGPGTPFCEFDSMRGTDGGARLLLRRPPADDHDQRLGKHAQTSAHICAQTKTYDNKGPEHAARTHDCVVCRKEHSPSLALARARYQ
jgi:hypothetical protein